MTFGVNPHFAFMGRPGSSHPHPLQDILTQFTPRTYRQILQLVEYVYYNHAHIYAAVKKFAEYPITKVIFNTEDVGLTKAYDRLLNTHMKIKRSIINAAIDLFVYGNSLISVQKPFIRFLVCDNCKHIYSIKAIKFRYNARKLRFTINCKECGGRHVAKIRDIMLKDPSKINIIRWDPKFISFNHNPVMGVTQYYYDIEPTLRYKIEAGDPFTLETIPETFLKAVKVNKPILFRSNSIYHMFTSGPAGVIKGIGLPPLISTIKLVYHSSILRRANEAIAIDHLVPMRVMFPQISSPQGDPIQMIGMSNFVQTLQSNLRHWRWDQNHIMISPFPVGVTQLGENARPMLVDSEIRNTDDTIIAALGLPRQFFYGELSSLRGGTMLMRSIENMLFHLVSQLDELVQFVADSVGPYMGLEKVECQLQPFKRVDDVESKQFDMQLWQAGKLSDQALLEKTDHDYFQERERKNDEQVSDFKDRQDVQAKVQDLQRNLSQQAMQQAGQISHNPIQMITEADQVIGELQQMDQGMVKSRLHTLQQEDFPMYATVIARMKSMQREETMAAKTQVRGSAPPMQ